LVNLNRYNNGFSQFIKDDNVNIIYKVDHKRIYFKDKKNGILIKIKKLHQEEK
jgi:hypothetical protein